MRTPRPQTLRRWVFFGAMSALTLGTIGLVAHFEWRQRAQVIDRNFDAAALHALAFEDHLTQTFNVVGLTLTHAAEIGYASGMAVESARAYAAVLRQAPYLRSLALLAADSTIVAGSNVHSLGRKVGLAGFLPTSPVPADKLRLGPPWTGRDFDDGRPIAPDRPSTLNAPDFLPVARALVLSDGRNATLLAAVNGDHFLNHYGRVLDPANSVVDLLRNDGTLLISTAATNLPGARQNAALAAFRLADSDFGRFEQRLADGRSVLTAFRASSAHPFVIAVHLDKQMALKGWREDAATTLSILLGGLLAAMALATRYYFRLERAACLRGEAEAALQISEAQYRNTFEHAAVGIAHAAPDGRLLRCNQYMCDMLGYTLDELTRKTIAEITCPEDLPEDLIRAQRQLDGELPHYRVEKRYVRKSGERIWVYLAAGVVRDAAGAVEYRVAVVEDIHLRKLTGLALQALNTDLTGEAFMRQMTRTLATLLDVEIALVGEASPTLPHRLQTRAVCVDGVFAPDFSYDLDGTPCETVTGNAVCVYAAQVRQRFPADALLTAMDVESYAAVPLGSTAEGATLGVLAVMSRRPLARIDPVQLLLPLLALRIGAEVVREREARKFRDLFDCSPDAIFLVDVQGRIRMSSRAGDGLYGWGPQGLIGQSLSLLFPADHADTYRTLYRQFVAAEKTGQLDADATDMWGARKDGSTFPAQVHVHMLATAEGRMVVVHVQDISARKRVEQELRESQALLSVAGRVARVGGWSIGLPEMRVVWSDVVAALHDEPAGFSPSLERGIDYFVPEHRGIMRVAVERCVADGTPYDIEVEKVSARGRRFWVRTMGEAVHDPDGRVVRIQGAFQEITDRKRAELETRRVTARLSSTLESITDGFYTVDRDWRFTYVNGEAERMFQMQREALIGCVLWEAFPALVSTEFEHTYRRAARERTATTFVARYAPWDTWFRVSVYPSDEGLTIYLRDITVEHAARRQLELLEASVAQLNDMVVIFAVTPVAELGPCILFVNDAFVRGTGYAREDVLGKSPRLLHGPLTDLADVERIDAALARFEPVHAEQVNYRTSGEPYWVELDIVPVDTDDAAQSHFVAIGRDITERKRDQDALRDLNADLEARVSSRTAELNLAREDAEQANRAKSAFLATMSHEIRTPMNGVVGMIEVLEHSPLASEQREAVRIVRESAHALLAIVDDVLDFSKIEAGRFEVDSEPMNIAAVVEGVCDTLDPLAGKQGVELTLFTDAGIPEPALGDAARLRQVLLNLVGNAIKFSGGRDGAGAVSVRAGVVERESLTPLLEISVADNGIGMAPSTLSGLFKPFSQADSGTTRRFGGTGLGLSISHGLAELMGGAIGVTSELGHGSVFTVTLPLVSLPAAPGADAAVSELAGLRCLVLGGAGGLPDDLSHYLEHGGVAVQQVPDLAAAGAWLSQGPAGLWTVILAGADEAQDRTHEQLRAVCSARPTLDARFVVIGRGRRREPRLMAADHVSLDRDVMHRGVFLKAVALAAGRAAAQVEPVPSAASLKLPGASLAAPGSAQAGRILIAEDNEVNRRVALRQLALLGFTADIAADGEEALASWRSGQYALLVTDLHMPEMDGFELAKAIRSAEAGRSRMPIVALTANALKGEVRRCLEAGMDDCMTKPVQLAALRGMLAKWLPAGASAAADAVATPAAPADLNVLAALVGDDPLVINEMLQAFGRSAEHSSAAIRHGFAGGALRAMTDAAHSLKSGARAIGAIQLGELCAQIESVSEVGPAQTPIKLAELFDQEMDAVRRFIEQRQAEAALR